MKLFKLTVCVGEWESKQYVIFAEDENNVLKLAKDAKINIGNPYIKGYVEKRRYPWYSIEPADQIIDNVYEVDGHNI